MRVAIIGAGTSGLTSTKCCLDEGLEPVCFEKGSDLGGLWRYTTTEVGHACVYRSCVMVTSKEMSCFSDFPAPKDYPLFLPHSSVKTYVDLYADNFKLRPYIRFNTKILKVTRSGGQWKVTYQKRVDEVVWVSETESFDAVLICSGHHWKPEMPKLVGADQFLGKIIHSNSYKDAKDFLGKNFLVVGFCCDFSHPDVCNRMDALTKVLNHLCEGIWSNTFVSHQLNRMRQDEKNRSKNRLCKGIGDSGSTIAIELSQLGGKVYLSTRRGSWITSRLQAYGIPCDQFLLRRLFFDMPRKLLDWVCMKAMNFAFDHQNFGLLPRNSYLEQPPVVNDYLPYKILSGSVLVKPDVVRLTAREAHFADGSVAENLDVVVLATGYRYAFPFLEDGFVEFEDNSPILYKHMFRVEDNPTLAFIGCLQPVGCLFSVAEIQARVATRLFKGLIKLPDVRDMRREIEERMGRKNTESYNAKKHATTVYYIPYCDDLADIIGCKPRLGELLFTDPLLAYRCYFGPCSPPQYRLTGPGAWDGARQAIMELPERNVYLTKKKEPLRTPSFGVVLFAAVGIFLVSSLLLLLYI